MSQTKKLVAIFLTGMGILLSFAQPSGAQWVPSGGPGCGTITDLVVCGPNLFASTRGGGVFMSRDNGTSWTAINSGLPECTSVQCLMVGVKDAEIIRKYIKESIVEKVIYRDIPNLFRIKEISVLESLLTLFMDDPGQIIDLASLANDLKISRQTLSLYLSYLEQSFLVRKLHNFAGSRRKVERKLKKIYPAVVSPVLLFKEDDHSRSRVFESSVVNQLNSEFFWRDPYKNEVDVILDGPSPLPIEIKYGKIETGGVRAFMKKFKVSEAIIISRDKEYVQDSRGQKISVVPAFKHFFS
ncbi:MAG TPA: hypothetical protein DIW61_09705 [Candidatus Aminicenantes bacterium]|nr:hypothetical protein [Candidatus Aminicenantes bacterium]